jgi:hypothetical protein
MTFYEVAPLSALLYGDEFWAIKARDKQNTTGMDETL